MLEENVRGNLIIKQVGELRKYYIEKYKKKN